MRRYLTPLCLGLCLSAPALAQDTSEPTYLEGLLQNALSGDGRVVTVEGFEGAWSSSATIKSLRIADSQGEWLSLENLRLIWSRAALLRGQLEVQELSVEDLVVLRAPITPATAPSPEASGFALPDLPVGIHLDALKIERAHLAAALVGQDLDFSFAGSAELADGSGQAQLQITRLDGPLGAFDLTASYVNATTELDLDLSLQEAPGGLVSHHLTLPGSPAVRFDVQGAGPIDNFKATLGLETDAVPRLSGAVTLAPTANALPGFTAELDGDLASLFAPEYQQFFGANLRLDAQGHQPQTGGLVLDQFALNAAALALEGAVHIGPSGWPSHIDLNGQIGADTGAVLLPFGGDATEIQSAQIALAYDATQSTEWTLKADTIGLKRPDISLGAFALTGQGHIVPEGRFDGQFQIDATQIALADPSLAQTIGHSLTGQFSADWAPGAALTLSQLDLAAGDMRLKGQIATDVSGDGALVSIAPDMHLTLADLSRFQDLAQTPLSGAAALALKGSVAPIEGRFDLNFAGQTTDLNLAQPVLDPLLKGPGAVSIAVRRDETGTFVDELDIATNHAKIAGVATLKTGNSSFALTADVPQVALSLPGISGAATLEIDGQQAQDQWEIQLRGGAPGSGQVSAAFTISSAGPISGHLDAEIAELSAYAKAANRPLRGAGQLSLTGNGDFQEQSFETTLALISEDLALGIPDLDALLGGTSEINIAAKRTAQGDLQLDQARLQGRELTADVSGRYSPQGHGALTFAAGLRDIGLLGIGINGPLNGAGTARLADGRWTLDSRLSGPGGTAFDTKGTVSDTFETADLALRGTAPLALANPFIRPRTISGLAQADLRLKGALSLAALSGTLTTTGARIANPDLRIALQNLRAALRLGNSQVAVDIGADISSGGQLSVTGPVSLNPGYTADLRAALNNVKATDPELYQTVLNGSVAVAGPLAGGARISGELTLEDTELRVPANSGPSFANLPGLKHRFEPAKVRRVRDWAGLIDTGTSSRAGPAYPLDLQITAPSRIFVRGRGLDAELGGTLTLSGDTNNVIPQGQFELIRGRMDILGKRLTLSEGLIQLQGAFDPFLRFVAQTETAGTTARIILEGPASAPELSFDASPDLPQDEVLARILFGKGLSTISPLQAVRLAAAIRTLTGKGGEGLAGKLRKGLALDDLDVSTSDTGTTQAKAGKYISENIYTEVIADSAGKSQINLNLQISPTVTARGRLGSDGDSAVGIFVEKDY
mgnify:CR=1 FL=1